MKEMHVCLLILVESWLPLRSIVTSRKLTNVMEIFEVKMMLLCCLSMLLMKLCKRSKPCDHMAPYYTNISLAELEENI